MRHHSDCCAERADLLDIGAFTADRWGDDQAERYLIGPALILPRRAAEEMRPLLVSARILLPTGLKKPTIQQPTCGTETWKKLPRPLDSP